MVGFIDDHRGVPCVEPICEVLPIAPPTYHAHVAWRLNLARRSARAQRDAALIPLIERVFDEKLSVYGVRKVVTARSGANCCARTIRWPAAPWRG